MTPAQQRLLERVRQRQAAQEKQATAKGAVNQIKTVPVIPSSALAPEPAQPLERFSTEIVFNAEQKQAIEYAKEGKEFCLIGAAGTGKTTTVREIVRIFMEQYAGKDGEIEAGVIALVSFTNRAVTNIAKAVTSIGAQSHCYTIHKFLGYHPEPFTYYNEDGEYVSSMRFVPEFTAETPRLDCRLVVVDESSMVSTELFGNLKAACPNALFVFIGDLNQLKPVMGDSVLGYKLGLLPVVELVTVYRQAMESPIIRFQHDYTLKGKDISDTELGKISEGRIGEGLKFHAFKKELPDDEVMAEIFAKHMCQLMDAGQYDWRQDTILIPYNKGFGTVLVNKHIAEHISQTTGAEVHEIIAGRNTYYYAVGDFIMYDKKEYIIDSIHSNPIYAGKFPQSPSPHLSRFGYLLKGGTDISQHLNEKPSNVESFDQLLKATSSESEEDVKNQASHIVNLRPMFDEGESSPRQQMRTAGDFSKSDWGYAMTVHKSQGSEWRNVWLVMTNKQRALLTRECLYTGMTRAREKLTVFYSKQTAVGRRNNSIAKAIRRAEIPGVGWKDKVKHFYDKRKADGKLDEMIHE